MLEESFQNQRHDQQQTPVEQRQRRKFKIQIDEKASASISVIGKNWITAA